MHPLAKRLLSCAGIVCASLCHASAGAATLAPAEFKGGDAWSYLIVMGSPLQPEISFRQEYIVLWKAVNGNFQVGERRAETANAWATGQQFPPGRCAVFIPDLTYELGDEFCTSEVPPGTTLARTLPQGKRTITFKGFVSAPSPLGFHKAAHFLVDDQYGDSTAPSSTRRVWELWFVPELRAFTRMKLRYEDAAGVPVRVVNMTLYATSVQP